MTPTKRCSKCHTEKPLSEFYENRHTKSGFFSRCKTCVKTHQLAWRVTEAGKASIQRFREKNPDKWKAYNVAYGRSKNGKAARKKYRSGEKGREIRKSYLYRRYGGKEEFRKAFRTQMDASATPEKEKAWSITKNAIRLGKITRIPCACGNPNSEAHHEDYSKPLEVIFLCASCHQKLHHQKRLMDLDTY
jgi:hypothetical protein